MIMRITWGRIHPGKWDEYEKTYNATVVAKSKNIKGLRGRWLAQDMADKDAGYSVSLWDSAEDMQAYEQSEFLQKGDPRPTAAVSHQCLHDHVAAK